MDTTTAVNLFMCAVIVGLAIVAYFSKKSMIAMYIGVTFALYGISHIMTLMGLAQSLSDLLIIVRTLGYLVMIFVLYKILKP